MKLLKNILTHLTLAFSVALLVPLIIDLFFNDAMGFINNTLYKSLFLVMLCCAAVSSALHIYVRKKRK